jgi:hypothetical protein
MITLSQAGEGDSMAETELRASDVGRVTITANEGREWRFALKLIF